MPTIKIEVVSGEIQFIRKELRADELYPTDQRYNPTMDETEYTPDGGTTWVPAPEIDPRHQGGIPPRTGSDVACQSAGSVAEYIKRFINLVVTLVGASATLVQGATAIVGFMKVLSGSWAILFELMYATFGTLASYGASTIAAAFDDTVYHQIACILSCHMDDNGQLNQSSLDAAMSDITANIGSTAGTVTNLILSIMGFAGVNKAASFYDTSTDCGDCGCSWTACVDWTTNSNLYGMSKTSNLTWELSTGYRVTAASSGTHWDGFITFTVPAGCIVTHIETVVYAQTGAGAVSLGIITPVGNNISGTGGEKTVTYDPPTPLTSGQTIQFYAGKDGSATPKPFIRSMKLRGTGDAPSALPAC